MMTMTLSSRHSGGRGGHLRLRVSHYPWQNGLGGAVYINFISDGVLERSRSYIHREHPFEWIFLTTRG